MKKKLTKKQKAQKIWRRYKKKSPRVPDITCPAIDEILKRLEIYSNSTKTFSTRQYKVMARKLELLRTANEKLRDSGYYWHETSRELFEKLYESKVK